MKTIFISTALVCISHLSFAQLKLGADGKVMVGSLLPPKEQFQIGDRWAFINGGIKSISYNTYFDGSSVRRFTSDACSSLNFDGSGNVRFDTGSSGVADNTVSMTSRFMILNNGNVGINTGNPKERFQIGDRWTFGDAGVKYISYNTYYDGSSVKRLTTDACSSIVFDGSGNINFSAGSSGAAESTVYMNDRLTIYNSGEAVTPNTIYAANYAVYSDRKFKSDIKPLVDPIAQVVKLRGVSYNFSMTPEQKSTVSRQCGFIAQELQEVLPGLVKTDKNGQLAVNYIEVIPYLVEAIKAQQQQISNLKELITQQSSSAAGVVSLQNSSAAQNGCQLLQNHPNPFSVSTTIQSVVPAAVKSANLFIYDITGAQKHNFIIRERGNVDTVILATSLSPGMYYYTLVCDGNEVGTKRMIITD